MTLSEFLNRRLIFVSGKGGVGKSTLAGVLTHKQLKLNRRTWLIEWNTSGRMTKRWQQSKISPRFTAANFTPPECLKNYLNYFIKWNVAVSKLVGSTYVTNFLNAIPGLNEVLILGQIVWLVRNEPDLYVVVDAPATGHGLSVFEVPYVLKRAARVGPLHAQASKIIETLEDSTTTALGLVTLAEEMPVAETFEYAKALSQKTAMALGPVFVNQCLPALKPIKRPARLSDSLNPYFDVYDFMRERAALQKDYIKILQKHFAGGLLQIPFAGENLDSPASLAALADLVRGFDE
jgi:anion-transporting  ArsA/GET3 family ATPase